MHPDQRGYPRIQPARPTAATAAGVFGFVQAAVTGYLSFGAFVVIDMPVLVAELVGAGLLVVGGAGLLTSVTRVPMLIAALGQLAICLYWLIIVWSWGFSTPTTYVSMAALGFAIMPIVILRLVAKPEVRYHFSALRGR